MGAERLARSTWAGPLLVATAYGAAALLSLVVTRNTSGVATMWPSSGILLAGLAASRPAAAGRLLVLVAIASMAANLTAGTPPGLSVHFTIANLVEGWVAVTLLRRWCAHRPSFISARDVTGFCGAVGVASLVSTAIAGLGGAGGAAFALSWFTTVALGMLVVAPLLLILAALLDPDTAEGLPSHGRREYALLLALVAAATFAVFGQNVYPTLFVPLMAVLLASYRLGPFGAAAGVLTVALVSSWMTAFGLGPVARLPTTEAALFLQFYFLALFATALPLAAVLTARTRLAARCAKSERRYRLLADSSNDMIVLLSARGVVQYVSPAIERLLGYQPADLVGQTLIDLIHADDRAVTLRAGERVYAGGQETIVYRQRRRDGTDAWLEAVSRMVEMPDGRRQVVASIRDISKRRAAELTAAESQRKMQDANRLLMMAERAAGVGHWRVDFSGETLFWSPEVFRIHGVEGFAAPLLGAALDFYHPDDRPRVGKVVEESLATAKAFEFEARIVRVDGTVGHVVSRGQPEIGYDGEPIGLFGTVQDVTRQVLVERELKAARQVAEAAAARAMHMADTDALTGVASRRKAMTALDDMIVQAEASGEPLALAIFDVDHFKAVNDRHGHQTGDTVLIRVARAAREAVRPTDLVGRLGGEEFVVLLPGVAAIQAMGIADQIRRAIADSASEADAGPAVTASLGIATFAPGGSAAILLAEADRALYRAKAAGRNATRLAA
jgi:diguanylate cyclase (GGDEF)-like protein/PAS domain S-box-containing protein